MNEEKIINNNKTPVVSPSPKPNFLREVVKEIVIFGLVIIAIFYVVRPYIAEPYLVDGRSMDPTFATSDYLIVDKLSYRLGNPERNSVVVFRYPNDPEKSFIKRIIGLPGETVVLEGEKITIINEENPNGLVLDQGYVTHPDPANMRTTLSDDEYFVMGDNRPESFDSRSWGPLEKEYILGRPLLRLFPLSKLGLIPGSLN